MNELISKVVGWARDRNLTHYNNMKSQMLKCVSEVGELADNVNKQVDVRDDIGDVLVTLIILAEQNDTTIEECLNIAYQSIKNRKGVLLDGVFIKDTDERYEGALAVLAARRVHEKV